MNKNQTKIVNILLTLFILMMFNPITSINASTQIEIYDKIVKNDCSDCIGYYPPDIDYVTLDTFPVDLDLLFWEDQPSIQAESLNLLGNGSKTWMLTPWGGHFVSGHFEGAPKWYFYCGRPLDVVAPKSGKICNYRINNGTIVNINGTDMLYDVHLGIDIGSKCTAEFEHLTIPVSLHEMVQDNSYTFTEGDFLGYPKKSFTDFYTIDFHYFYKGVNYCPFPALSVSLQEKISTLFNLQYEREKQAGVFPESNLCNNLSILVPETFWGVWEYSDGPLNEYFNDSDPFSRAAGGITLLSRDLTNPDTFWRNLNHPTENMTSDFVGLFVDGSTTSTPGYDKIGESMVKLAEGDNMNGILELITVEFYDWGHDVSVYARFSTNLLEDGLEDDLLTIEYFGSLVEAQAGFTDDAITYQRFLDFDSLSTPTPTWIIVLAVVGNALLLGIIITIIVVVVKRKKKVTK
ncbi:MAG: hypothetical protein ACTSXA_06150 [Candidatus Heimdallarchaeota archaeon]